jgi:predicted AAA+ superfamily ATPase
MLAHLHGQLWNASQVASSLGTSPPTMRHWLDILADTFMLRILPPYHANLGKRLVKSPKIYLRDSGLLNALLGVGTLDALFAHPVVGPAWEGLVIEHLVAQADIDEQAFFYRTTVGAELDLVLASADRRRAFEIKFGLAPKISKGYHQALADLEIPVGQVIYTGDDRYQLAPDAIATSLADTLGTGITSQ